MVHVLGVQWEICTCKHNETLDSNMLQKEEEALAIEATSYHHVWKQTGRAIAVCALATSRDCDSYVINC
jgi:hypothetical protein